MPCPVLHDILKLIWLIWLPPVIVLVAGKTPYTSPLLWFVILFEWMHLICGCWMGKARLVHQSLAVSSLWNVSNSTNSLLCGWLYRDVFKLRTFSTLTYSIARTKCLVYVNMEWVMHFYSIFRTVLIVDVLLYIFNLFFCLYLIKKHKVLQPYYWLDVWCAGVVLDGSIKWQPQNCLTESLFLWLWESLVPVVAQLS